MNRGVAWVGWLLLAAASSVTAEGGAAAQSAVSGDFLVSHVRVFDGEHVQNNMQVAVADGIIRDIGTDLARWNHLPVVDGHGATLIPGLIDAHVHVERVEDLHEALRFGVTTVLDMGTVYICPQEMSKLRQIATMRLDVADIRSAGFGAPAPGGHPTEHRSETGIEHPVIAEAGSADAYVNARRREGSDYLKIFLNGVRTADRGLPNLDLARVKALVIAAHSRGMLAVAHVENLDDVAIALDSSVDGLAHIWRKGGASPDIARRIASQKVFVIATLDVGDGFTGGRAALLADPRLQPYLSSAMKEKLSRPLSFTNTVDVDGEMAAVHSLHDAGVVVLAGTDASHNTPAAQGVSLHRELELLNRAGLQPAQVLSAATAHTAKSFGLNDRGRIAAGLRADMVLVRGDPTSDITATRDILRVWRSGIEVDRRPARE